MSESLGEDHGSVVMGEVLGGNDSSVITKNHKNFFKTISSE